MEKLLLYSAAILSGVAFGRSYRRKDPSAAYVALAVLALAIYLQITKGAV